MLGTRSQRIVMSRNSLQGVFRRPIHRTVNRPRSVRIHAFYRHLHSLHDVTIALQGHLDDGVQRNFQIRYLIRGRLEEVAEDAS